MPVVVTVKATVVASVASGVGYLVANGATYTNSVSLGAILISTVVGAATLIGVIFGVRYRTLAKTLEQERDAEHARGDRIDRDLDELKESHQTLLAKHEAYRDQKHTERSELHALIKKGESDLELERQKHDYSGLVAQVASLGADLASRTPLFEQLIANQERSTEALDKVVLALDTLLDREQGKSTT